MHDAAQGRHASLLPGPHHPGLATALVIGVTSHRDIDSTQLVDLRRRVRESMQALLARFPQLQPVVLSPLAEGGDRLVAEVGLELGARLLVPLPLPLALYVEDFATTHSRAQFEHLLGHGETLAMPLPDSIGDGLQTSGPLRDRQYLQAGLFVASHCHVLFALWDGSDEGGLGGTAQVVRYYLGGPLPGARRASDNLRQMLAGDDDSLVLHFPVRRTAAPQTGDFNPEPRWCTSGSIRSESEGIQPDFARIFERMCVFEDDRRAHQAHAADDGDAAKAGGNQGERLARDVDRMALAFQRRTLGAMRAIHGLAVLMGLAFLLYSDLGAPSWMLWVFLGCFLVGLVMAVRAHRRDWHRKYIDYRALAEGLRVQMFWRRAGLSITGAAEFAHDNFMQKQDVELGWIRNVMRQVGMLPQPACPDLEAAVDAVADEWVGYPEQSGQLAYYTSKAALHERHHRRTRMLGVVCLWTSMGLSLLLALFHGGMATPLQNLLVTAMGTLSLLAAVREAYAYRKADRELVKQYRFMRRIYRNARAALDAADGVRERQEILRALGEAALEEHAEWALMHRDRPIEHGRP